MTLSTHEWLKLKPSTRNAFVKIFKIERSGYSHVVDNKVETDGYDHEALSVITVEEMRMLTHLNSDSFEEQFNLMVKMIEGEPTNNFKASQEAENATNNERSTDPTTDPISGFSAGEAKDQTTVGTGSGSQEKKNESKDGVLPVSGTLDQKYSGSSGFLPDDDRDDTSGLDEQDEKIDFEKPQANGNVGQTKPGVQKIRTRS